ncbi:MAG TPA: peptidoglycan-binding protein [Xanthobacteraceae bacterium]|nr:peptidoglycan-binding protein [Xanthobacteraceae bacterium]
MQVKGATLAVLLSVPGLASNPAWAASANANPVYLPEGSAVTGSQGEAATATAPSQRPKPAVSLRDSYAAIPLPDRIGIQLDLIFAGHYRGPINGEYSEQLVAAVRAFQRQNKTRQTGVLNPQERQALSALVRPLQEQVGWQMVSDPATGARVGLPTKLVPHMSSGKTGTLWSSAQGQVRIETFRFNAREMSLARLFEQEKSEPVERKIAHEALRDDHFVLIGMQGLKKMHVRAHARDGEIRGITILYDQAMDGAMDPLVPALAHSFQPFPAAASAQSSTAPRRKVDYGTGLVVSAAGHIVSDLHVTDGCESVMIPGLGRAERIAQSKELSLLRVYGAEELVPLALLSEPPSGSELTLVGVADPQSQGGGSAVSAMEVQLVNIASIRGTETMLSQAPPAGFSGAAAIDRYGRFYGMVVMPTTQVASTAPVAPRATIIPAETIRNFMEANYVAPASGQPGWDNAKASVVRIICVRK